MVKFPKFHAVSAATALSFMLFTGLKASPVALDGPWFTGNTPPPPPPMDAIGPPLLGIDFNRTDVFGSPSQSFFRVIGDSANQPPFPRPPVQPLAFSTAFTPKANSWQSSRLGAAADNTWPSDHAAVVVDFEFAHPAD